MWCGAYIFNKTNLYKLKKQVHDEKNIEMELDTLREVHSLKRANEAKTDSINKLNKKVVNFEKE